MTVLSPNPELGAYRLASSEWFKTQPRFFTTADAGVWDPPSFKFDDYLPTHFLFLELANYLVACLVFVVAVRRREVLLFISCAVLGISLEIVGVYITHEHMHPRYMIHFIGFLPLKEVLWYPMTLYPAMLGARALDLDSLLGEMSAAALFHTFQIVQYESIAYRSGVDMVGTNPDFPMADISCRLTKGPWINIVANMAIIIIASSLSCALRRKSGMLSALEQRGGEGWKALVLVGCFGGFLTGFVGLLPNNILKMSGCLLATATGHKALVPQAKDIMSAAQNMDLEFFFKSYSKCVIQSPVSEAWVAGLMCVVLTLILLFSLRRRYTSPKKFKRVPEDVSMIIAFLVGAYHATFFVIITIAQNDPTVTKGNAYCMWLALFLGAFGLAIFMGSAGNSDDSSRKTKRKGE